MKKTIKAWIILKYDLIYKMVPTEHSAQFLVSGRGKEYKYFPCEIIYEEKKDIKIKSKYN